MSLYGIFMAHLALLDDLTMVFTVQNEPKSRLMDLSMQFS